MGKYLFSLILLAILFSSVLVSAAVDSNRLDQDVDIVWSSSDGLKMEIYFAQRKDGIWLEPVQVTDDHYDNMYPVIDRDSSGRRWIFWTAYDSGSMELRYTTGEGDAWQTSEMLQTDMNTNISPSVVIDKEDRVWVVWSANDGGLDDIMYAYYQDNGWSDPETVHEENEVPDLLPVIGIDPAGSPVVTWRTLRNGENATFLSRWANGEWSEPEVQKIETKTDEEGEKNLLELPSFVKKSSMVFIRIY